MLEDQQEQLNADLKATSRKCEEIKREIEIMKDSADVVWTQLVGKMDELRRFQQGLSDLEALKKELF